MNILVKWLNDNQPTCISQFSVAQFYNKIVQNMILQGYEYI